jgi:hypothetical protein
VVLALFWLAAVHRADRVVVDTFENDMFCSVWSRYAFVVSCCIVAICTPGVVGGVDILPSIVVNGVTLSSSLPFDFDGTCFKL